MKKADVLDLDGKAVSKIDLPEQFEEEYRPNLIKRALLALFSHKRQTYGAYPLAGKEYAVRISRRRRKYKTSYGKGISRVPRKVVTRRGTMFNWIGAFAPGTVGGRRAHPPKAGKDWAVKINIKERRKALRSAIAATANKEVVSFDKLNLPIILDSKVEELNKVKDVEKVLTRLGLNESIEKAKKKKVRAGKGKGRGRKYKKKKSILFVVSKKCALQKAAKNLAGVDVGVVDSLNVNLLAPGTHAGRITVWSKDSIERLKKEKLFLKR